MLPRLTCITLMILLIFIASNALAQEPQKLMLPKLKRSYYLTTSDTTFLKFSVVDKVTSKFGFTEIIQNSWSKVYKENGEIPGGQFTRFLLQPVRTDKDELGIISDSIFPFRAGETTYIYGFTSSIDGNKVSKNFSKLLMSAYLQELDPEYLNNDNNFTTLVVKDKNEFRKRNWINMGYGMSYLAKDNPFMGGKKFGVGFFYVLEALHYIPIVGGPFFGKSTEDKIMIPLIGISSLAIWKGVISNLLLGKSYLKINQSVHESGYRVPDNLNY